jgi:molecular chaperone DnaK
MPMVRAMLKRLSGRTLNTSLSPDQSIAHGATYYAGMLLTNSAFAKSILNPTAAARLAQFKQRSANARALGVLIRDHETHQRVPHYILPADTQLPAAVTQIYGTVSDNQRRVHLRIVESGTAADSTYVELGTCQIEPLPENLPEGTEIEVTITYDEQARVHVSAKVLATGQEAQTEIIRPENLVVSALNEGSDGSEVSIKSAPEVRPTTAPAPLQTPVPKPVKPNLPAKPVAQTKPVERPVPAKSKLSHLEESSLPIPLCNKCGEPLDPRGKCPQCDADFPIIKPAAKSGGPASSISKAGPKSSIAKPAPRVSAPPAKPAARPSSGGDLSDEDAIVDFLNDDPGPSTKEPIRPKIKTPPIPMKGIQPPVKKGLTPKTMSVDDDVEESQFWKSVGE